MIHPLPTTGHPRRIADRSWNVFFFKEARRIRRESHPASWNSLPFESPKLRSLKPFFPAFLRSLGKHPFSGQSEEASDNGGDGPLGTPEKPKRRWCLREMRCAKGMCFFSYGESKGKGASPKQITFGGGFLTFLEFSSRKLGKWSDLTRAYFSDGLVQPPTRQEGLIKGLLTTMIP